MQSLSKVEFQICAENVYAPCLHPLQVVRGVLQVLANQQVLECHLFQLGLEVLSLPLSFFLTHHTVSQAH